MISCGLHVFCLKTTSFLAFHMHQHAIIANPYMIFSSFLLRLLNLWISKISLNSKK
ncbi:hypothetical protein Hanom_Chr14g01316271 [Helianthus anomalus]